MSEHKVIFTPSGIRATARNGQSVYDVALASGVDILSICGGKGLCRRCQIELEPGEHAKFGVKVEEGHLSPWTDSEERAAKRGDLKPGRRLACRAEVLGDVVIEVPSDARHQVSSISKDSTGFETDLDPAIKLYMCKLPVPQLDDNPSDTEALVGALREFGIETQIEHRPLTKLQPILAQNERELIAVVRDDKWIIDVWPPSPFDAYGAAIDIGST
ncbi:MAG: 2Fe-2S iron-sulfur cluster binding domain-containing protein, partial [Sphingomonadales bacterium]|nr:2Fe-2S iron-sulfur cluster binding domain-containing protein [Sphingomonadales bacterium]